MQRLVCPIVIVIISTLVFHCRGGDVCGNGNLIVGEECDDGNLRNGDGCNNECRFEDTCGCDAGNQFLCPTQTDPMTDSLITVCCESRAHPFLSGQRVCHCKEVEAIKSGTWVDNECVVRDVNECMVGNGGCAVNAHCVNLDATQVSVASGAGRECVCDSNDGYFGDGILRCDLVRYSVTLVLGIRNVTEQGNYLSPEWLSLQANNALTNIHGTIDNYIGLIVEHGLYGERRRTLLSAYDHYTFIFQVGDWASMQALASDLNSLLLAQHLQNATGGLNQISVIQSATASVEESPTEYTVAAIAAPGFIILNFTYARSGLGYAWDIMADFYAPSDTSYALFATKGHAGNGLESHQCVSSNDVCCLLRMKETHYLGDFGSEVDRVIAPWCDPTTKQMNASGLSLPSSYFTSRLAHGRWLTGLFNHTASSTVSVLHDVPNSVSAHDSMGEAAQIRLSISQNDVVTSLSESTILQNLTEHRFALGMLFFKGLSVPDMYVAVGQTNLMVQSTNSLEFVTATTQDYSFLEFLDVSLYEVQYWPSVNTAHRLQFLRVVMILPSNLKGVGIHPTSYQVGRAADVSELMLKDWINPCYSDIEATKRNGDGVWDFANGTRALYETAMVQSCSMRGIGFCSPHNTTIPGGQTMIEIDIPLGGELLPPSALEAAESVFMRFVVYGSKDNKEITTQVSSQVRAGTETMLRMCEPAMSSVLKDTDFVSVALSVGASLEPIEGGERGVVVFNDIIRAPDYASLGVLDVSNVYTAVSSLDSILTVSLEGTYNFFNYPEHDLFTVEIDHALMVHVRNDVKAATLQSFISNSTAFTVESSSGFPQIVLTPEFLNHCDESNSQDCAITHPIYQRNCTDAAHPLVQNINIDIAWILSQFGDTPAMRTFATEFAQDARSQFGFNWRYRRGWWISPTYPWPVSTIGLVDRSLLFIAFSVDRQL